MYIEEAIENVSGKNVYKIDLRSTNIILMSSEDYLQRLVLQFMKSAKTCNMKAFTERNEIILKNPRGSFIEQVITHNHVGVDTSCRRDIYKKG